MGITKGHLGDEMERGWWENGGSRPCRLFGHLDGRDEPLARQVDVSKENTGKPLTAEELSRRFVHSVEPDLGAASSHLFAYALAKVDQVSGLTQGHELLGEGW